MRSESASMALRFLDAVFSGRVQGQVGLYDDQPNTVLGGFGAPTTFSNFILTGFELHR